MKWSTMLFAAALTGYVVDMTLFVYRVRAGRPLLRSQRWILYAAFGMHTAALVLPSIDSRQCPLFAAQDSLSFLAWVIILACALLGMRYRLNALESFAPLLVILLMGASMLMGHSVPLPVNVPDKAWISLHAALYFLGYAAFALTFLAGLVYVILENQLKQRHLSVFTGDLGSLALMDKINHVALRVGTLCLTAGIAIGLALLKDARDPWLSILAKDPKIAIALFTWALYMALLFARSTNKLRGRKVAIFSMLGFAVVVATFLGVRHLVRMV